MVRYIIKRLVILLLVLWMVATTVYFTMHVTPGDTANAIIVEVYVIDLNLDFMVDKNRVHILNNVSLELYENEVLAVII